LSIDYKTRRQKQSQLAKEISSLIGDVKKEEKKRFAFWYKAVGEQISKAAIPVMNRKGVLLVKVQDSVWRFELTRRKDEILENINQYLKEDKKIKDIVFK
jgi:predicted nucleic acid-binding Zn ribbon protein